MTMMTADSRFETPRQDGVLHFAFTMLVTAVLTFVMVPAAALAVSYVAGGAATSAILFVYLFALLTNGPFLAIGAAIILGALAAPRLVGHLVQHSHA